MTPRDALEVVRQQLETLRNLVPDIEADSLADSALAVLSAIVDRAGEPVAIVIPNVIGVDLAWLHPPSSGRPPVGTRLYTLNTAPGASHD